MNLIRKFIMLFFMLYSFQELSVTGFKPLQISRAVNTDSINVQSSPTTKKADFKKDSKQPAKKLKVKQRHISIQTDLTQLDIFKQSSSKRNLKQSRAKQRHISVQTGSGDQAVCLQPMIATSLAPYLNFRHSSPEIEVEPEEEVEKNDKVEWLFQSTDTCARTHAMRPQVRLLRALNKNLEKYRPTVDETKYDKGVVIPDQVGWDILGQELQMAFIRLYKLMHLLELLPTDAALKKTSEKVVEVLKHILSHIPFPSSLTHTIDVSEINQPRTDAMALYLFGWKLKEVISVLQLVLKGESTHVLPEYFKAELSQADKVAYECLTTAMHGIRNTSISHSTPSASEREFLACDGCCPLASYHHLDSSYDSSDFSDIEDFIEIPKQRNTEQKYGVVSGDSSAPGHSNDLYSGEENFARVLKSFSMSQLISFSEVVQSRITKIRNKMRKPPSEMETQPIPARPAHTVVPPAAAYTYPLPLIPESVQRFIAHGSLGPNRRCGQEGASGVSPVALTRMHSQRDTAIGIRKVLNERFTDVSASASATPQGSGGPQSTCARASVTPDDVFSRRFLHRPTAKIATNASASQSDAPVQDGVEITQPSRLPLIAAKPILLQPPGSMPSAVLTVSTGQALSRLKAVCPNTVDTLSKMLEVQETQKISDQNFPVKQLQTDNVGVAVTNSQPKASVAISTQRVPQWETLKRPLSASKSTETCWTQDSKVQILLVTSSGIGACQRLGHLSKVL